MRSATLGHLLRSSDVITILQYSSLTTTPLLYPIAQMYAGGTGVYTHTFEYEKKVDCPVCSSTVRKMTVSPNMTLNELMQSLRDGDLRLKSPSITAADKTLYMPKPPALEKFTRPNLDKALNVLIGSGEELTVTDPMFPGTSVVLSIYFKADADMIEG